MEFKPKTPWNFEQSLLLLEILKDLKKSLLGDNKEHLTNSAYGILMLQKELEIHDISSEAYVLEKDKKPVGIILDCAGMLWSILGNDAIERTLTFQWIEPNSENIELVPLGDSPYFKNQYIQNLTNNLKFSPHALYKKTFWKPETHYIVEETTKIHIDPFIVEYPKDIFDEFQNEKLKIIREKDILLLQKNEFEDQIKHIELIIKRMEDYEEISEYTASPWFSLIKKQTQKLKDTSLNLIEDNEKEGIEFIHFNAGRDARKIKLELKNEEEQKQLIDVLASHLLFDAAKNNSYKNKEGKTIYFYDGWNPIIPLFFTDKIACCNQKHKYANIAVIANKEPLKATHFNDFLKMFNIYEEKLNIQKKITAIIQPKTSKGPRF